MTKKVNKYFMIVAVVFIILSLAIPIVDYYVSKEIIFTKVEGMTSQEFEAYLRLYEAEIASGGDILYNNYYIYFEKEYGKANENSIIWKAVQELTTLDFGKVLSIYPSTPMEVYYMFYIMDKVIWLFIAYCIFIIPISMVDLFYKMIKKEVD